MRKVVALVHFFDCSELLIVPTSNNQAHVYSQPNILKVKWTVDRDKANEGNLLSLINAI